jgi:hypothetical protein
MPKYIFSLMTLFLAACATQEEMWQDSRLAEQGYPPEYIEAHRDGCSSGYKEAGHPNAMFKRDLQSYYADAIYAEGWDEGFEYCKKYYESYESTVKSLGLDTY